LLAYLLEFAFRDEWWSFRFAHRVLQQLTNLATLHAFDTLGSRDSLTST